MQDPNWNAQHKDQKRNLDNPDLGPEKYNDGELKLEEYSSSTHEGEGEDLFSLCYSDNLKHFRNGVLVHDSQRDKQKQRASNGDIIGKQFPQRIEAYGKAEESEEYGDGHNKPDDCLHRE
ncbi:MAG: hypothetical protein Q9207_005769 [Kuettlingeria erythrocarpa]